MNFNRIPNVLRRSFPKKNKNRYDEFIPQNFRREKLNTHFKVFCYSKKTL